MQTRNRNTFTTIHTEGALLPVDLLQRISDNDRSLEGLDPVSYHLAPGEKINEAINRSWNRLNGLWGGFKTSRARLGPNDAGTTLTRERWLLPLFQELDFGRLSAAKAMEIEGKSYPISHRWENVPLHLVGCGLELDKRTPGAAGAARISPHSLLQEYLNRSDDAQWGLVSNGLSLRILRDNATLTRQAYVDFDLESMFEGEIYSDFVLLWLIGHQSRFEMVEKQSECLLERWSKSAQERGTRALDDLRRGVEEAIVSLGQGFLQHPLNGDLRARLKNGELLAQDYYRQLLRLVYRLIFLFAAEDRDLLLLPDAAPEAKERYKKYYSTARLRALAERQRGSRHYDRYEALRLMMSLLSSDKGCPELALPALGGFLFDPRSTADLNDSRLDNQSLLIAVRSLAFITEKNTRRAVDYRNLGPEELGSVYESLLELHPLLHIEAGTFQLTSAAGNERKTTGSYYTPTSLIRVLLDSALDPVIEDRLKGKADAAQQEQALLGLKVCDPACGSGHFLIAAAHRIAGRLAQARAVGDEPPPNETRRALRDVIRHCIYGVDINPMSVELCKVNLWLESLEPGKPLSFLDAHIKCGNSLVGVGPKVALNDLEIPDDAFNQVTGDQKLTAALLKKRNKQEREGQESLFVTVIKSHEDLNKWLAERNRILEAMPEDSFAEVQAKAEAYQRVNQSADYRLQQQIADLWTSAFYWKIEEPASGILEVIAPTQGQLRRLRNGREVQSGLLEQVKKLHQSEGFFHWPLEFAEVAAQGGFDSVLGNPPWERIKLQEEEFFAARDPEIAAAINKAARQKMILQLPNINAALLSEFELAKHAAEAQSKCIRFCKRFPLTAVGDINTYALFTELSRDLISNEGRLGIIVKSGIATDATYKEFFADITLKNQLISFFDFENREWLFSDVATAGVKFCLITIGINAKSETDFAFFCTRTEDITNPIKRFSLPVKIITLFNPNTKTLPTFRTRVDAEISQKVYKNVPVLQNEIQDFNPWGISFLTMFHMANDSHLFLSKPSSFSLPLYEPRMIHIYDHRWAKYSDSNVLDVSLVEKMDPNFSVTPQYWVHKDDVAKKLSGKISKQYLLGFRNITRPGEFRTVIFSLMPLSGVGHNMPLVFFGGNINPIQESCFLGNVNSLVFDYFARQKISGASIDYFRLRQLPILGPESFLPESQNYIAPRILELVYTSLDLKTYAEDMSYHGEPFRWDEERRALLRAELDAYYAQLYGLNRKQLRYILDPADLTPRELEDILDPWEEVADPLDPLGYVQRAAVSDFPGETFRVLKEKENNKYGEYRTRRLVLEAWEKLEAGDWVRAGGTAPLPLVDRRLEPVVEIRSQPVAEPVREEPAAVKQPKPVKREPAVKEQEKEETPMQPALSDFGLYKCSVCGKMVMGFEKEKHEQEKHRLQPVEWKKMR